MFIFLAETDERPWSELLEGPICLLPSEGSGDVEGDYEAINTDDLYLYEPPEDLYQIDESFLVRFYLLLGGEVQYKILKFYA